MKSCELLLPPIDVQGVRYTEVGDRFELTDGDAELFGTGINPVVRVLDDATPETPETPADPEATDAADGDAAEVKPAAKAKAKR
jgi:hypothetical protein